MARCEVRTALHRHLDLADMHHAVASGSDAARINAMLVAIADQGALNDALLPNVTGLEAGLEAARAAAPAMTGLDAAQLAAFCALWAGTKRSSRSIRMASTNPGWS